MVSSICKPLQPATAAAAVEVGSTEHRQAGKQAKKHRQTGPQASRNRQNCPLRGRAWHGTAGHGTEGPYAHPSRAHTSRRHSADPPHCSTAGKQGGNMEDGKGAFRHAGMQAGRRPCMKAGRAWCWCRSGRQRRTPPAGSGGPVRRLGWAYRGKLTLQSRSGCAGAESSPAARMRWGGGANSEEANEGAAAAVRRSGAAEARWAHC